MQDYWWNLKKPKEKEKPMKIIFNEDSVSVYKPYGYAQSYSYTEAAELFEAFKNLKAEKQNAITRKIKELESKR